MLIAGRKFGRLDFVIETSGVDVRWYPRISRGEAGEWYVDFGRLAITLEILHRAPAMNRGGEGGKQYRVDSGAEV